ADVENVTVDVDHPIYASGGRSHLGKAHDCGASRSECGRRRAFAVPIPQRVCQRTRFRDPIPAVRALRPPRAARLPDRYLCWCHSWKVDSALFHFRMVRSESRWPVFRVMRRTSYSTTSLSEVRQDKCWPPSTGSVTPVTLLACAR